MHMKKNFFLEGPIQTGKSTLIRRTLGEHLTECGGFCSQRLTDRGGNTCGFRITAAATGELTAPMPDYPSGPEEAVSAGIFKYFDPAGGSRTFQQVFDLAGTQYLLSSKSKPLILLDEIGGAELLSDPFRDALYDLLDSDIPCLGVIKLEKNALRMQRAYSSSNTPSIAERNRQLRQYIENDPHSLCMYFQRTPEGISLCENKARDALIRFIDEVFGK